MEAGRELDALVAEKVMGWVMDGPFGLPPSPATSIDAAPACSTNITAAWRVVEKMEQLHEGGDCWRLFLAHVAVLPFTPYLPWEARFQNEERTETGRGTTAPHAICLAALRALGVEV